jgi:hypothetical protein
VINACKEIEKTVSRAVQNSNVSSIKKLIEYFKINFIDHTSFYYKRGGMSALNTIVTAISKEVLMEH